MPTPHASPVSGQAAAGADVSELLDRLGERYQRRSIVLKTSRKNLLPADYHVQGIARIDHPYGTSSLVCSATDDPSGTLWIGSFQRERFNAQGRVRERLSARGVTVATVRAGSPHPGGMQAAGTWLAVACEGGGKDPCVEIYDLADPLQPHLHARLALPGRRGAGWVALAERASDDLVLFVGGPSFARKESWLYGFQPSTKRFRHEGSFDATGMPAHAWGPQNSGALFACGGHLHLITLGNKGTEGYDPYRERVRCFELGCASDGKLTLTQEPHGAPENYVIDAEPHPDWAAGLFFRAPGLRWGSSAFLDAQGELIMYVTERNPQYRDDGFCHLQIVEIRQRV